MKFLHLHYLLRLSENILLSGCYNCSTSINKVFSSLTMWMSISKGINLQNVNLFFDIVRTAYNIIRPFYIRLIIFFGDIFEGKKGWILEAFHFSALKDSNNRSYIAKVCASFQIHVFLFERLWVKIHSKT